MKLKPGVNLAEEDHKEAMFQMVEAMRISVQPKPGDDPDVHASLGMSAASILAGIFYSTAVAAGIQKDTPHERRKCKKMLMRNFDAGLDIGLRAAARLAKEGETEH